MARRADPPTDAGLATVSASAGAGPAGDPGTAGDEQAAACRRREIERGLAGLVTPALVEEHRRSPAGRHSPALAQVLAYLRQAPVAGKLAAFARVPGEQWTILRLSGDQGVPHGELRREPALSEDAVAHEVFLQRLRALGMLPTSAGPVGTAGPAGDGP